VSVALVIQHAMRMRSILLSSVARLAVSYLLKLKARIPEKKVFESKMCILI
jgi:hypothetical protein